MSQTVRSVSEERPGEKWQDMFRTFWPAYRRWFLKEGHTARPTYHESSRQLRAAMPELFPLYERLVELAGGGDVASRFLSLYCPTPYLSGCSQVAWPPGPHAGPALIRNYDYRPDLWEGVILRSGWNGRAVLAMSDCLWGVLDGVNESGLAVSLAFGGRKEVGRGFGMPLLLRYVLEFCESAFEAAEFLVSTPSHMAYNITLLDASGAHATVQVSPGAGGVILDDRAATNHQEGKPWREYARATASLERYRFLESALSEGRSGRESIVQDFLSPPLHSAEDGAGFGTLYTAVYDPVSRSAAYLWPGLRLDQSIGEFSEGTLVLPA